MPNKYYVEHTCSGSHWLVRSRETNMCRVENVNTNSCSEWFSDETKVREILDKPSIMETWPLNCKMYDL